MIGPSSHISKLLLSLLLLLLVFYAVMDVSMYVRIQQYPLQEARSTNTTNSSIVYYEDVTWLSCSINPLCYPTVKALMLDHTNHYLFAPVVSLVDLGLGISSNMPFITPNMISYSHVLVAAVSGRLVSSDCLAWRRVGVLLFQLRTFMDDLDGHVARARNHVLGERTTVGTTGYYVDGICDLLGCICLIIGIFCFLKNNPPRRGYVKVHTLLPHYTESSRELLSNKDAADSSGEVGFVYKPKVSMERMLRKVLMFSGQLIISSIAWNRYIDLYQETLEREAPDGNPGLSLRQGFVFRSGFFFAVAWLWKVVNVHSLLHLLLLAVFCDKLWELLRLAQVAGLAALVAAVCFTEMHLMKVQNYVYNMFVYNNQAPS